MTYAETIPARWGRKRRRHHGMHMFGRRHGRDPFGRGGWGGPGNAFFGGGRRAGRGDIRAAILALLAEQGMAGTPAQREQAQEVLRGARRSLYQILAEEEPGDKPQTNV